MNRVLYFLISVFVLTACQQQDDLTQTQVSWSGTHPFSIPLKVREQQIEKGNLIKNFNFEQGKYYTLDSSYATFDLPGWSRIGNNVFWVSTSNTSFSNIEVSEGKHAIKIVRNEIDETEKEGDGIISEFIKVIPGNYEFTLDIKLENIQSQLSRLGTKLFNTIDVRLQFYDKNKIEINSVWYSEHYKRNIDNSFKAINIAQFKNIDSTDWVTLIARSSWEPFTLENIPSNAYYTRVKVCFKGSGVVWLDNISLKYTNRNLSLYEQMISYIKQDYDATDLVIPTPQYIEKKGKIYIKDSDIQHAIIWLPYHLKKQCYNAADELKDFIAQYFNEIYKEDSAAAPIVSLVYNLDMDTLSSNKLIIKFDNKLPETIGLNNIISNKNQAYALLLTDSLPSNMLIYSAAKDGFENGVKTLKQLFNVNNATLSLANIEDYPAFETRAILFDTIFESPNNLKTLTDYKASMFYYPYGIKKTGVNLNERLYMQSNNKLSNIASLVRFDENVELSRFKYRKYEILLPDATNAALSVKQDASSINNLDNLTFLFSGNTNITTELDYFDVTLYKNNYEHIVYYDQRYLNVGNGKLNLIFEPFVLNITQEAFNMLNDKMIIALNDNDYFNLLNGVTALDFMWNPEKYNPVFSLYKALVKEFSSDVIHRLLLVDKTIFEINQLKSKNSLPKMQDLKSVEILQDELLTYLNKLNKIDSTFFNSKVINDYYHTLTH